LTNGATASGRGARPSRRRPAVRVLLALFLLLLAAAPAAADAVRQGPTAAAEAIVDGDTLILKDPVLGARQVRLVGIQAPKLPLGRPNFPTWPLAEDSKAALAGLALGRTLRLSFGGSEVDRHGRLLAHLHVVDGHGKDGLWVQGEMLRLGMARVYSFPDNRARVAEMLKLEGEARAAKRGIWGHWFYAVRAPAETVKLIGTFQVVEGVVRKAAKVKGTVYLNFGDDWRSDFTLVVDGDGQRLFRKAGLDPAAFEGRRVRARGWLKERNGPMIAVSHPEQVEPVAP
jgi:endonuclease YncB( thermonuclease family)